MANRFRLNPRPSALILEKLLLLLLLLLSTAATLLPEASTSEAVLPQIKSGELNVTYNGVVKQDLPQTYLFRVVPLYGKMITNNLRLKVGTNATPVSSLIVTILQPYEEPASFRLEPFAAQSGSTSTGDMYYVERTICPLNANYYETLRISVTLSTEYWEDVPYSIVITISQDFLLEQDIPKTLSISQNTPQYFRFQFEESMNYVRIFADSSNPNPFCMTFSVQTLSCSVFDHLESVQYQGMYKTITSSGALYVKKREPFMKGFLVVLFVHPNNQECMRKDPFSNVLSSSPSSVEQTPTHSTNSFSVTLRAVADSKIDLDGNSKINWWLPILISFGIALTAVAILNLRHSMMSGSIAAIPRPRRPTGWGLCKFIKRKFLANKFIEKFHASNFGNGSKFICQVGFVGLIYSILSYQLAFLFTVIEKRTGDMDLCYHNPKCAQPMGPFLDLNHLVSNVSYMVFGVLFVFIVTSHERKIYRILREHQVHIQLEFHQLNEQHLVVANLEDEGLGIPPNFGIFKALGVALCCISVLSSCYHVCPNETTFQFDTYFMNVIAMLTIALIYQQRHPRCLNSNHVFGVLSCIVFLTFMGFLAKVDTLSSQDKMVMGASFWAFQLCITFEVCFNYCMVGVLKDVRGLVFDGEIGNHIFIRDTWRWENFHSQRLFFSFFSILLTMIMGVFWMIFEWNVCAYLLYFLITTVVWSVANYFIMKVLHGEFTRTSWILPSFYFLLSGVFAVFAMKYYLDVAVKWELTPSESRAVNHECLNIFGTTYPHDSHDAWSFLSASSIFFAFNGLLILDDDLIVTPRADILVF